MGHKQVIEISDLPEVYGPGERLSSSDTTEELFSYHQLKEANKAFETAFIKRKLDAHAGDIDKTAKSMGLTKEALRKKIKQLKEIT